VFFFSEEGISSSLPEILGRFFAAWLPFHVSQRHEPTNLPRDCRTADAFSARSGFFSYCHFHLAIAESISWLPSRLSPRDLLFSIKIPIEPLFVRGRYARFLHNLTSHSLFHRVVKVFFMKVVFFPPLSAPKVFSHNSQWDCLPLALFVSFSSIRYSFFPFFFEPLPGSLELRVRDSTPTT